MIKKILRYFLALILIAAILTFPVKTKKGINYTLTVLRIPLYVKVTEYLDRNYWYKRLTDGITAGCATDTEKVIAIFNWVMENIHRMPPGFDVIDDHTLNVIIRRYGTHDQMADAFTTLCVYAGIPAFFRSEEIQEGKRHIILSYVLLDNKWRVFDVYRKTFFLNKAGEIASVEDIVSDPSIAEGRAGAREAVNYEDFFNDLKPIKEDFTSKAQKQVPILRLKYEIKRTLAQIRDFFLSES